MAAKPEECQEGNVQPISRPFTLQDVYRHLNKPKLEVLQWFQELGLIAKEVSCSFRNCKRQMVLASSNCIDSYQWVCSSAKTKHTFKRSVRKGTWFEGSRLAMEEIVLMIYFWIHEYLQSQVRQELNITNSESVVAYYGYCREVTVDAMARASQQIGGYGVVVEISASRFIRRKGAKKAQDEWVYCGVELGGNFDKCFMATVVVHYTTTFIELTRKYVLPGTTIYCECLVVYKDFDMPGLQKLCSEHLVTLTDDLNMINGSRNQPLEGLWAFLKPRLPPYNRQRDKPMFTGYLAEYLYRKKIRDSPDKFLTFANEIATLYPPSTSE